MYIIYVADKYLIHIYNIYIHKRYTDPTPKKPLESLKTLHVKINKPSLNKINFA